MRDCGLLMMGWNEKEVEWLGVGDCVWMMVGCKGSQQGAGE